jgi:hypothetical protein
VKIKLKIAFFILTVLAAQSAFAGKIENAFNALNEYNYFKAKDLFEKSFKKETSPAAYGLAQIYYRADNPFHSIDSAFKYVKIAEQTYGPLSEKKKTKYKAFGFDYLAILEARANISSEFYKMALQENSVLSFSRFIINHPWSNEVFVATHKRDSIAYSHVKEQNTSLAYQGFIDTYPESKLVNDVQADLNLANYKETTKSNSLVSYLDFLKKFPDNPYSGQAENRIYEIVTESNSIKAYYTFVTSYPNNRNVGDAWRRIYQLYMVDFSDQRIEQFKIDYPTYPYREELEIDMAYLQLKLLPFKSDVYYGFMDYNGAIVIPSMYEQLGFFKEGLSLAMKDGKYGFIDKGNRVIVPFLYESATDFEQGRALVEKDSKQGMIDRTGGIIFPISYSDLGAVSEGLVYAQKDSLYGYYDKNNTPRISERYQDAFPFLNGMAKVQIGENQAYIDEFGSQIVPPGYEEIDFFNDSLLIFIEEGLKGLMRKNCRVLQAAEYEEIGKLSLNRSLVVKNGLIGYIDGTGKNVIPCTFETYPNYIKRSQFMSNMAIVKSKGKFGVIDLNGKVIVPTIFEQIGDISSLIAFTKGKGWGFMDLTGKQVLSMDYDYAESFKDGLAIVEKLTLQGAIDPKGKVLIPLSFTSVDRISKELYLVSNGGKYGVYSNTGEMIVPLNYQQIRVYDKDFLVLTNQNELHYLYLPEKRIIQPIKDSE